MGYAPPSGSRSGVWGFWGFVWLGWQVGGRCRLAKGCVFWPCGQVQYGLKDPSCVERMVRLVSQGQMVFLCPFHQVWWLGFWRVDRHPFGHMFWGARPPPPPGSFEPAVYRSQVRRRKPQCSARWGIRGFLPLAREMQGMRNGMQENHPRGLQLVVSFKLESLGSFHILVVSLQGDQTASVSISPPNSRLGPFFF